ncbi:MAG: VOC family protein [Actinobacteria bacterium]|nr:VOC family protein [Actinomycetota bacterium]
MFRPKSATAALPAQDISRAKRFYGEKLGLNPVEESDEEVAYRVADTQFILFPSSGKASGDHTQLAFEVEDLESDVRSLRENGVVFEEYDQPGFKSSTGIVELEGEKGAWFKDSEGNLIAIAERSTAG